MKKKAFTINATETQRTISIARNYFMQNVKNIEEMETFLITYKITNLNQEERENLSRQIKSDGM